MAKPNDVALTNFASSLALSSPDYSLVPIKRTKLLVGGFGGAFGIGTIPKFLLTHDKRPPSGAFELPFNNGTYAYPRPGFLGMIEYLISRGDVDLYVWVSTKRKYGKFILEKLIFSSGQSVIETIPEDHLLYEEDMSKISDTDPRATYKDLRKIDPSLEDVLSIEYKTALTMPGQMANLVLVPMELSNSDYGSRMDDISEKIYARTIGLIDQILMNAKKKNISARASNLELVGQGNPLSMTAPPQFINYDNSFETQIDFVSTFEAHGTSLMATAINNQCSQLFAIH